MVKNNILFISEMPPVDTYASSAVFYRHLKFLEAKGFNIHVMIDANSFANRKKDIPKSWRVFLLPNRKWFLPPYKPNGLLQKIRYHLYYELYAKPLLKKHQIDLMIGFIYGEFLSPFCAFIKKKKSDLPYISFFHDDPAELNFNKNRDRVIDNTAYALTQSDRILIASKGFYSSWPTFKNKFQLLPPVPEPFIALVKKKNLNEKALVFGYSGSIYNELLPYFEQLAKIFSIHKHKLLLIGNNSKAKELAENYKETVAYLPLFNTAQEANDYLLANSDCYIIPYPDKIEKMPWIRTCFPSKFIQIAQLGLPTMIIAPKESALGQWCIEKNWELYSNSYKESEVKLLISKIFTGNSQAQIAALRDSDFSPKNIQDSFYKTVKELLNESI